MLVSVLLPLTKELKFNYVSTLNIKVIMCNRTDSRSTFEVAITCCVRVSHLLKSYLLDNSGVEEAAKIWGAKYSTRTYLYGEKF